MDGKIRIAITGMTTLESFALKTLIHEEHEVSVDIISGMADLIREGENVTLHIVSDTLFVANLSFFMPRAMKTIVVTNECQKEETDMLSIKLIWNKSDVSEIKEVISRAIRSVAQDAPMGQLSQRETEVLRQIALGKLNKEIADFLCISINTVITHRKNISAKLGIKSASGLGRFAMMNGLV